MLLKGADTYFASAPLTFPLTAFISFFTFGWLLLAYQKTKKIKSQRNLKDTSRNISDLCLNTNSILKYD